MAVRWPAASPFSATLQPGCGLCFLPCALYLREGVVDCRSLVVAIYVSGLGLIQVPHFSFVIGFTRVATKEGEPSESLLRDEFWDCTLQPFKTHIPSPTTPP